MRIRPVRLRVETLEDRCNPALISIAGTVNISAADYTWQIQNSSTWTVNEAFSNGAVPYQYANGTTGNITLDDAFDGAWTWGLAGADGAVANGANGPLLYRDLDASADVNTTPNSNDAFPAGTILTGDPAAVSGDNNRLNGLYLWEQSAVFNVGGVSVLRTIGFVANPTSAPIGQNLIFRINLGSDRGTVVRATSSGDTAFTPADNWTITSDRLDGSDPLVLIHFQGGFGSNRVPQSALSNLSRDNFSNVFAATLQPGETQAYMTFTVLSGLQSTLESFNPTFASAASLRNAGLLAGLDDTTLGLIQNWDVAPPLAALPQGLAYSSGIGAPADVRIYTPAGDLLQAFTPFDPAFVGGVSVARGDYNGDGVLDTAIGAGFGGNAHVKVYDGATGAELLSFYAFENYQGAISVALGDLDGDGKAELIVGSQTDSNTVHVYATDGTMIRSFYAYSDYAGGLNVSASDLDGDGKAEVFTSAVGAGGGPHVKAFSGADFSEVISLYAAETALANRRVSVAVGDLNGDGYADIVSASTGPDGARIRAINGRDGSVFADFSPFVDYLGEISIGLTDLNGDGSLEIVTGSAAGTAPHIKAFEADGTEIYSEYGFEFPFVGGVNTGVAIGTVRSRAARYPAIPTPDAFDPGQGGGGGE